MTSQIQVSGKRVHNTMVKVMCGDFKLIFQARRTSKDKLSRFRSLSPSFLLLSHEAALFPEQQDDFFAPLSAVLPAQHAAAFLSQDPFLVVLSSDLEVFVSAVFEAALVPPRATLFID